MNGAALHELTRVLPVPGPVWGLRPMRDDDDCAPPWRRPRWGSAAGQCLAMAQRAAVQAQVFARLPAAQRGAALVALRRALRREGLAPAVVARALGAVATVAAETLGWTARPSQHMAAAALLANRMAEMATGEGKTLAIALAAAVAALAGVPVHVVTANPYLANRDAARLAPFFAALGLRAAALQAGQAEHVRRAVYAQDIVYATAKDLAFDFLRDRQTLAGRSEAEHAATALAGRAAPAPLMRGLCWAVLDEADSILLDEAEVPLILSRAAPHAARRAFLWQALSLARALVPGLHFTLQPADRAARLSPAGEERLAVLAADLGGPWQRPRYRREAVLVALAALHLYQRDAHYVVKDGAIELLDEVTGRVAVGRVWSRGLHTVVALKEGLRAPAETETVAQTTFQRFFQRYWRLCGISGTLWEARAELRAVYGAAVVRVPLHQPCRRRTLPSRCFEDPAALFEAVAERAARLSASGRPVLVGSDSVDDTQRLSRLLQRRGVAHAVLNALNDADEAAIVAAAGRGGQVTVATRMAGRGTDIELDAAALAAGGLHVLSCQHNASRRHDRQLAGRAGRQGDPGSAEAWSVHRALTPVSASRVDMQTPWKTFNALSTWLLDAPVMQRWRQRQEERRRAGLRRQLLAQDLAWERRLSFAGRRA